MTFPIERGLARTHAGYIHWRACGQGPTVMIGHINQQSSALMLELLQQLAPDFRAVAIDYPSHGHSDHFAGQPEIDDYVQCTAEVMDALGIEQAFALGEAVGAAVSFALAAQYPERIAKVLAVNTPFFVKGGSDIADIARVRPSDPSGFPAPRSVEFMRTQDPEHGPMNPTQSWMDRINTAQFEIGRDRWQTVEAYARFDLLGNVAKVRCPVLMLYGEHFIYARYRDEVKARCPQATVELLADARFCLCWERAPEIAARARAFLLT
jgi:pimeloyl-ACP methyl ester carboxylesterase